MHEMIEVGSISAKSIGSILDRDETRICGLERQVTLSSTIIIRLSYIWSIGRLAIIMGGWLLWDNSTFRALCVIEDEDSWKSGSSAAGSMHWWASHINRIASGVIRDLKCIRLKLTRFRDGYDRYVSLFCFSDLMSGSSRRLMKRCQLQLNLRDEIWVWWRDRD